MKRGSHRPLAKPRPWQRTTSLRHSPTAFTTSTEPRETVEISLFSSQNSSAPTRIFPDSATQRWRIDPLESPPSVEQAGIARHLKRKGFDLDTQLDDLFPDLLEPGSRHEWRFAAVDRASKKVVASASTWEEARDAGFDLEIERGTESEGLVDSFYVQAYDSKTELVTEGTLHVSGVFGGNA